MSILKIQGVIKFMLSKETTKIDEIFIVDLILYSTGCVRQNENHGNFKIVKESMLVQKQTTRQQKALDLSFNLEP